MQEESAPSLGDLLRLCRDRHGLTQEALAAGAPSGLTVQTVRNVERGRTWPRRHTLDELMRALQADGEEREALVAAWAIRATSTVPGNPARTIPTWVPAGASPRVRPLVGRERAEAELADRLRRENMRLVTLTGPGGVGKTSLALSVASTVCDEYPDGFVFVDLSSVRDSELVIAAIAEALGLGEQGTRPLLALVLDHLAERQLLLVLDNFEQVLDAAKVVAELFASCPGVRALVTSRMALRLRDEQVYPVAPLPYPKPGEALRVEALSNFPAVAPFVERARARRPEFAVTPGTPLRSRPFAPVWTACRWPSNSRPPECHGLLAEDKQVLFRRMSVFARRCTLAAVVPVCADAVDADDYDDSGPTSSELLGSLSELGPSGSVTAT